MAWVHVPLGDSGPELATAPEPALTHGGHQDRTGVTTALSGPLPPRDLRVQLRLPPPQSPPTAGGLAFRVLPALALVTTSPPHQVSAVGLMASTMVLGPRRGAWDSPRHKRGPKWTGFRSFLKKE